MMSVVNIKSRKRNIGPAILISNNDDMDMPIRKQKLKRVNVLLLEFAIRRNTDLTDLTDLNGLCL